MQNLPHQFVIGIDEAGRGPWAGPICGAGIFIEDENLLPKEIRDSKTISENEREELSNWLKENFKDKITISLISAEEIDTKGLSWANKEIFQQCINGLSRYKANIIKVDGTRKDVRSNISTPIEFLTKGERKSKAIAAASIIAKTTRDAILKDIAKQYPYYGFELHKGYGTKLHLEKIKEHGIIKGVHRLSFKPITNLNLIK